MSCKSLKRKALALEDLEPALWGTLPPCLLDLVFLRLPVAEIGQLRLLSKLWKASLDSVESEFNQLLEDKVYPNLFGLIGQESPYVWMLDVNQDRWCVCEIDLLNYGRYVGAADGGLVCFVSVTTRSPLTIVVMNPLTGKKVELPRLLCIYDVLPTIQPSMLQLKMNRKNNEYLVFFAGYIQDDRGLVAQVYDSRTKDWSVVGSREKSWGHISGYSYDWTKLDNDCYKGLRLGSCLYDFAQQLLYYEVHNILRRQSIVSDVVLGDRLFILDEEDREGPQSKYIISEFHLQQNEAGSMKGETHGCVPLDYPVDDPNFDFHACNGYLMVMAYDPEPIHTYVHVWLYNLSTRKWHLLPNEPGLDLRIRKEEVFMSELRWSATP